MVVVVWTGWEAAALRTALRLTLDKFAEYLGVGRRTVSDWEAAGSDIVPTGHAAVFGYDTQKRIRRGQTPLRCADQPRSRVRLVRSPGNGDDADRRQAVTAVVAGGLATAFTPLTTLERIAVHHERTQTRVDAALIADHEDLADALASRWPAVHPDVLFGQVAHQAYTLLGLLDRPMTDADRRRLDAITVGAHIQAGLTAFGLGDRREARRFFATAWSVASEANDSTLCARTLGLAAVLHSPIESGGSRGDTRKAIALMRHAVHHARRADPATHAFMLRWLGLELAAAGDEPGFHASFEAAERLPEVPPDGHGFVTHYYAQPPERASNRGIGLVRVGRAEEAVEALTPTLDSTNPYWCAMALSDIAAAWMLQDDPERTCQESQCAIDCALDAGYAMGLLRIRGVRIQFPPRWDHLPCVRELDERLRLIP